MLLSNMYPQPARYAIGYCGCAASTSGRTPGTNVASPTFIFAVAPGIGQVPAGSPGTGSRQITTLFTPTSSSAQPVKACSPDTPVMPLAGLSNDPIGPRLVPGANTCTLTAIVIGEFAAHA